MNPFTKAAILVRVAGALALLGASSQSVAQAPEGSRDARTVPLEIGPVLEGGLPRGLPLDAEGLEKYNAGSTIAFDNDLLSFGDRDFDYTGGGVVTLTGRRAKESRFSLDRVLSPLDRLVPATKRDWPVPLFTLHSRQIGLIAFTPDDLNEPAPIVDDRPYASLAFIANARTFVSDPTQPVYETTFTLGVLGLDLAKAIQRGIHEGLDLDEVPEGWDHQISDGGEPTFRFTWARQSLLASNFQSDEREYELKWRLEASAGYLTEGSVALSGRWGRINTPWWSFTPERADYASQPAPVIGTALRENVRELYVWAGVKARLRAYNAFLQGQFRSSDVEFSSNEIEHVNVEAWIGVTWQISTVFRLSYAARYQTAELEQGPGSRDLRWAGFIVSRDL